MKNQVVLIKKKGINGAIGKEQEVISTIRAGHIPLVYGNREAILSASWRSMLDNFNDAVKFLNRI